MAIEENTTRRRESVPGQRLLVDTGKMSVRRITRSEASIMSELKGLAPIERATLSTVVDALQAKKRKRSPFAAALENSAE